MVSKAHKFYWKNLRPRRSWTTMVDDPGSWIPKIRTFLRTRESGPGKSGLFLDFGSEFAASTRFHRRIDFYESGQIIVNQRATRIARSPYSRRCPSNTKYFSSFLTWSTVSAAISHSLQCFSPILCWLPLPCLPPFQLLSRISASMPATHH